MSSGFIWIGSDLREESSVVLANGLRPFASVIELEKMFDCVASIGVLDDELRVEHASDYLHGFECSMSAHNIQEFNVRFISGAVDAKLGTKEATEVSKAIESVSLDCVRLCSRIANELEEDEFEWESHRKSLLRQLQFDVELAAEDFRLLARVVCFRLTHSESGTFANDLRTCMDANQQTDASTPTPAVEKRRPGRPHKAPAKVNLAVQLWNAKMTLNAITERIRAEFEDEREVKPGAVGKWIAKAKKPKN